MLIAQDITKRRTITGLLWFILSLMLCNGGDVLLKLIGTNLPPFQITFFRFFFSCVLLLPFFLIKRKKQFYTPFIKIHGIRALILVLATTCWVKGVPSVDLTIATLIGLSIPIVILPICYLGLREKILFDSLIITFLGLGVIILALQPNLAAFNFDCLWLIFAIFLYGILDVINKIYADKESLLNMLFYSSLFGIIFSFPGAFPYWKPLQNTDLLLLIALGGSADLILFCIIKAYQRLEISFLAPFHYLEFPQSVLMGRIIFNEYLSIYTLLYALIIIILNIYLTYCKCAINFLSVIFIKKLNFYLKR